MNDGEIDKLVTIPKKIINPTARWLVQRRSRQKTFQLDAGEGMPDMELKLRCNEIDPDNFSCVLLCHLPNGEKLTLRRYNGSNHVHGNALDSQMPAIEFACHIHMAKQRYIEAGLKCDGYAVPADYSDFCGALLQAMQDCRIEGFPNSKSGPTIELFDE
ncbi:hypothetical protein [Halomonas sp.]|uniref:hypothetical protein n=1 Tax=Halomonas sp. TaxID=1486246 RepID=UPI003A91DEE0